MGMLGRAAFCGERGWGFLGALCARDSAGQSDGEFGPSLRGAQVRSPVVAARNPAGVSNNGGWTLLHHGGRDYLPLREIGAFYKMGTLERSHGQFRIPLGNTALRGTSDSQEFFISHLKFILSYPIRELEGELCMSRMDLVKLVDPVLRPGKIIAPKRVDTIVLDPGHGGSDAGAGGRTGEEKVWTLDVALRAREQFLGAGYQVHMTRVRDEFVSLEDRVRLANQFDRALLISVHFNSSGKGSGVETYTLAPRGVPSMAADGPLVTDLVECPGNARDAENMALATAMHAAVVARSKLPDRGIKRARFLVIREALVPSVLVEGGFLSNPEEFRQIASPRYRQEMALGMVEAVRNYRRAVTPDSG